MVKSGVVMGYGKALENAWGKIGPLANDRRYSVRFLDDTYDISCGNRAILSRVRNTPAKDYTAIILLHYLARAIVPAGLPQPSGRWIDFRTLGGGEAYYPVFKKRAIDRIAERYGTDPDYLVSAAARFGARPAGAGDAGIAFEALDGVPLLIELWRGDDEFAPAANILFDAVLPDIFCTEDIVVLTEIVVHTL